MFSRDKQYISKRNYYDRVRFGGNREKAILRDGERCVRCGLPRILSFFLFGCDLTVNHRDGRGRNHPNPNHEISNLETVCRPCHGYIDSPKKHGKYSKYTFPIGQVYMYQLWLLSMYVIHGEGKDETV